MSTLSTTRSYEDGEDLTQDQLDDLADSIETWANGNIGSTNIATSGVDTTNIASSAVTAAKIASDAVTTAKILDANVTGAKLASGVVDASTLQLSAGVLSVKDGGITQAKRAALGQQISSSCGSPFTTSSTSYVDVTNLSVSITTTGRPVFIGLVSDGSGSPSRVSWGTTADTFTWRLLEGASEVATGLVQNTNGVAASLPVSSVWHIYAPSAGTYTYKMQAKMVSGTTLSIWLAKLVVYEL